MSHIAETISPEYAALNAELHARNPRFGTSGHEHLKNVCAMFRRHDIKSALDYGCGKATLSHYAPWLPIANYDPAVPEFAAQPKAADLVICTDVLEHIEPQHLDTVLDEIERLTIRFAYLEVAIEPALKTLADGRNAHLTVEPIGWWLPKLCKRFECQRVEMGSTHKSFLFWGKAIPRSGDVN